MRRNIRNIVRASFRLSAEVFEDFTSNISIFSDFPSESRLKRYLFYLPVGNVLYNEHLFDGKV